MWTDLPSEQRATVAFLTETFVTGHPLSCDAIRHPENFCGVAVRVYGERSLFTPCAIPPWHGDPSGRCYRHSPLYDPAAERRRFYEGEAAKVFGIWNRRELRPRERKQLERDSYRDRHNIRIVVDDQLPEELKRLAAIEERERSLPKHAPFRDVSCTVADVPELREVLHRPWDLMLKDAGIYEW